MTAYLQSVRAELRKLYSIRSTYYVWLLMFILEMLFSFYIFGFKVTPKELVLDGSGYFQQIITNAVFFVAVFPAFVCTLMITHEYRHNTILYAFTSSPSRLRIMLAKITVATIYSALTIAAVAVIALSLAALGNHLAGHQVPLQSLPYHSLIWQVLFYGWGTAMIGLLIGFVIRNQVVAIVSLLVIPNILEQILSLVLKGNSVYMPFTALCQVIGNPTSNPNLNQGHLSPGHAALVVGSYLLIGYALAAILFVRRSAN